MEQQYKRRTYIIDRAFQLKFVRLFMGVMFLLTAFIGTVSYWVLSKIIEKHLYSPHISALSSGEILRPAIFWINVFFTGALVVVSVVVIFFHLRRVTGSLRRFSTHLAGMSGHLIPQTIHFRQTDPLHLVANDFNVMVDHLGEKITSTRTFLQLAVDGIHDLRVSSAADSKISSENFKDIQRHLAAAEQELRR